MVGVGKPNPYANGPVRRGFCLDIFSSRHTPYLRRDSREAVPPGTSPKAVCGHLHFQEKSRLFCRKVIQYLSENSFGLWNCDNFIIPKEFSLYKKLLNYLSNSRFVNTD